MDKLAENIPTEQGKTLKDNWGDVFRGLGTKCDPLLQTLRSESNNLFIHVVFFSYTLGSG